MRKISILIAVCMLVGIALNVIAQQQDLDAAMKEIGATYGPLRMKVDAKDAAGVAADAAKLQARFAEAESFFMAKKLSDGAMWAAEAKTAAADLAKAAKANDMTAAATAYGTVGKNCKGCHGVYRQQDPATKAFSFKAP
jgi:cytochrome c556